MDIIFDFIFEVILEGSFELVMNKKIPLFVRIVIGIPLIIIYVGLFLLITSLMFDALKNHEVLFAFVLFIIDILYILLIYYLIKKRRNHETKR